MIIRNVHGTVEHACHCESWLDHWRTYSGQRALYCVVRGCVAKPEVGGHVQERGTSDENIYVIPLCRTCSEKSGQELEIFEGVNLVSINTSVTCGKQLRREQAATGR